TVLNRKLLQNYYTRFCRPYLIRISGPFGGASAFAASPSKRRDVGKVPANRVPFLNPLAVHSKIVLVTEMRLSHSLTFHISSARDASTKECSSGTRSCLRLCDGSYGVAGR